MLKKLLQIASVALLLAVPLGSRAQTERLVVADGTATNSYLPIYGMWVDAAQHNQVLYPSSMLTSLAGDSLKSICFYMSSPNSTPWGTTVTLSLAEVGQEGITALLDVPMTTVWTGIVNGAADSILFEFTQGFAYHGGGLLVDITTTAASYNSATFIGMNTPGGGVYSYNSTTGTYDFVPKAAFTSVPGSFTVCPPPADLTIVPNSTFATLSWTGDASAYALSLNGNEPVNVTSPYTLSELTPGTTYNVGITAICAGGDSSFTVSSSFFTPCVTFDAPYTEGFEANNSVSCFNMLQTYNSYGTVYPYIYSYNTHTGSGCYYFNHDNLVVMPKVNLNASEMHVSFWAYNSSTGLMEAGYITNPSDASTFVPMVTVRTNENEWLEYEFYTDSLSENDTVFIAFRHSGSYNSTYIDDIVIEQSSECRRPSASSIDSITTTEAYITWHPNGTGTEYELAYATRNDASVATVIPSLTDTTYTITNLHPNVKYWFWVRTLCDGEPTAWHYVGHDRTACSTMVAPLYEDFSYMENGSVPTCWTVTESTSGYSSNYPYVSGSYLYFYPRYGQNNVVAMPLIDLPVNEMDVTVYAHGDSYGGSATMEIGYVTSLEQGATFTALGTFAPTSTTPEEFEFNTASLSDTLDTIYLAFRASTSSDYANGYIDAVEVRHLNTCPRPSVMTIDSYDHESVTLSWTGTEASEYVVRVSTVNNVESELAIDASATDTTVTVSGLDVSTHYYTWVASLCGSDTSDWRQGPEFTTACGADFCEVTIDMVDSYGDGWNGNAINVMLNGSPYASATINEGYNNTFTLAICEGDSLELTWQSGSYASETSLSIAVAGVTLLDNVSGEFFLDGQVLYSTVGCPTCNAPTAIAVSAVDATSITIGWTPESETHENWAVYLNGTFVAAVSNTPEYTFTGLTANTIYQVAVGTICGDDTSNVLSTSARTDCANGSCSLTFDMVDSYGDGWNGGGFNVYTAASNESTFVTIPSGGSALVQTVPLCNGDSVFVQFASGYYPSEMSFSINFGDGRALATNVAGNSIADGDTLFNGPAICRSCATPANLALTAATPTSATVAWTAGDATSWKVRIADTTGAILSSATVSAATHTFTGLTQNTPYEISVIAFCSATDSSWDATLSFSTPCPGVELPWHDDFMAYNEAVSAPGCWSAPALSVYQGYSYPLLIAPGRYSVLAASKTGDTLGTAIAATPQLLAPANDLYVRIKGFSASDGTLDTAIFEAGYMTDVYNPATFVPVIDMPATNGEIREFEFLTNTLTLTDSVWVAVRVKALNGTADEGLCGFVMNEIYVSTIPACQRPENLAVNFTPGNTDVTATLTWNAVAGSTGYTVEIVGDTSFTVTTASATLPNLSGNATYTVRVYNNCSATEQSVPQSLTFTTPCVGFALPYSENFENFPSGFPECWTRPEQYPGSDGVMTPYITGMGHESERSLYYRSTSSMNSMAVSPVLYGQANNVHVSFWVYGTSSAGFEAGIMTDPEVDSTFIPLLVQPSTTYTWTQYEFNTDSLTLTDTTFHFALRATNTDSYAYAIYVDDVEIATIPECSEEFVMVKADRIGGDSAWIYFQTGLGRNESSTYTVDLMNSNDVVIASASASASPVPFTNLTPSTEYHVRVSLTCGGDVTAVSDTVSFTTRCPGSSTVEVTDSASTASNSYYPVYAYYNHSVSQSIYADSLLGGPHSFASLSINCSTTNNTLTGFRGRIWLKEIPDTVYTVNQWMPLDSMTLVYDGDLPLENGWNEFMFTSNFEYSGNGNLMVCMMADTTFGNYSSGYNFYRHPVTGYVTRYYYNDGSDWEAWMANGTSGYTSNYLTDMRFSSCGELICDATMIASSDAAETTATLTWYNTAANYEVAILEGEWDSVTAFTPVAVTDTTYTFSGLTAETLYTLAVRVVCDNGLKSDWVTVTVTTDEHPCFTPSALTVTDVTLTSATLGWTIGEAETQWQLHVTGTNYDETFTVTTNPYTVTGLTPAVTYSFTVSAICSETQTSDPSEAQAFTTESCQPVSGVNVSNITTTTATVTWTAPAGVTSFEVEYGASGFNQGAGTTVQASTNSASLTGLTANMAYDVYVRSVCGEGIYSAWSSANTFTTDEQGEGIDDVNSAAIALYPNPATTTVTISGIEGQAMVTIVDMNGRVSGEWRVENGEITLDLTGYAQGAYFVRITGEQQNAIRKLIVK